MNVLLTILFLVVLLLFIVFIKLIDVGMSPMTAALKALIFPFLISKFHFKLYFEFKDEDFPKALKALFYPITNFPDTIVGYGEMFIRKKAFYIAVLELLNELDELERARLVEVLIDKGILRKESKTREDGIKNQNKNSLDILKGFDDFGKEYIDRQLKVY